MQESNPQNIDAMSHILKIAEIDFNLKSESMEDEIDDLRKELKRISVKYESMKMRCFKTIINQVHNTKPEEMNEIQSLSDLLSQSEKDSKKKDK